MKIKTRCEHCGAVYVMAPEFAGRTAICKKCHNQFAMIVFEDELRPPAGASPQPERAHRPGGFQPPGDRQAPAAPPGQGAGFQGDFAQQMARQQSRPGAYEPPQSNFSQPPGAPPSRGPGGPDQAAFPGGAGAAGLPPAGVTAQIFTCKKCGYTAEIPPVSKSMKVKCQNCGAKTTVKPLPKAKAAKGFKLPGASGGGPPKILFLLVFIIIIAALVLFVGPSVLGFPDLLSGILP